MRLPLPAETVVARMAEEGFLAGVPVGLEQGVVGDSGEGLLVAVTERRTRDEIDAFVSALEKVVR